MALSKQRRMVADWNLKYPVGTRVIVHRDNGEHFPTSTRSDAFISKSGIPVIWVEGISGYYALSQVFPENQD